MEETTKKNNKMKIAIALGALVVLVAVFTGLYFAFAPKASKGAKEIAIEVVDDKQNSKSYTVNTDAEYLRQAMEETKDLTFSGTESEYGLMVTTVNGVTADYNTDKAYWAFYVNGEYCSSGIDSQPVENGQKYRIVYTK